MISTEFVMSSPHSMADLSTIAELLAQIHTTINVFLGQPTTVRPPCPPAHPTANSEAGGPAPATGQDEGSSVAEPLSNIRPASGDQKWYAITVGREPGVYQGSHCVAPNISDIPGGLATRFYSEEAAQDAYNVALSSGKVVRVNVVVTREVLFDSSIV
ncbi:hypothetical protein MD484_g4586, partial [Candolleomyces efflorescens]